MDVDREVDGKLAQQFGCMGTCDKDSLIAQFRQILNGTQTDINQDACAFFLDMNNWNLTAALGSFYDYNAQEQLNTPEMVLIDDITVGDGESVNPGTHFVKTWRLNNPGKHAWPAGCTLQRVGGSEHLQCSSSSSPIPSTVPVAISGQTVEVSAELLSPTEPGVYQSVWRLITPNQVPFGDEIWCIISVDENGLLDVTQRLAATHCSEVINNHSISLHHNDGHNRGIFSGMSVTPAIIERQRQRNFESGCETWRKWEQDRKRRSLEEQQMTSENKDAQFTECKIDADFELCRAVERIHDTSTNEDASYCFNTSHNHNNI